MDELVEVSLGDVCSFKAGDAFKRDFQGRKRGDHPFIKVSDMNLEGNERIIARAANWVDALDVASNRYTLHKPGSVVFAKIGIALTYNRRRMLISPTVIDNNMMAASPKEDSIDPLYLYYLLSTIDFNTIASGSALPFLTQSDLQKVAVRIHLRAAQQNVAATLGAIDEKIELNRRTNETLESMARALFKDWFLDFGPTRAKMEGRDPYLAPEIWALFPDRFDVEGKPEEWALGTMSDLFTLQRGFDLPSQDRQAGSYTILAASGPSGTHDSYMVKGPGVTTGRSGVLGRVFYVQGDFWPLNTSLWVKDYKLSTPLYAYFFLNVIDLAGFNAGSAVPTLNRNHIHGLPAVLPPRELIVAFDSLAEELMQRQKHNELENEALAQTRDLLLPKLMSGEARLRDAEIIAGEAL